MKYNLTLPKMRIILYIVYFILQHQYKVSLQEKGVRIVSAIITVSKKSTSRLFHKRGHNCKNSDVALARFQNKRLPRPLIAAIKSSKLKNLHGCGLYDYLGLACAAKTYYKDDIHSVPTHAYLKISFSELMETFRVTGRKSCLSHLEQLKTLNLIGYKLDVKSNIVSIFLLSRQTVATHSDKTMKIEKSFIKRAQGFIFVSKKEIKTAFASTGSYSECDMAIYLWLHAVYNDPTYKVSQKSAVVALPKWGPYFSVRLSNRGLSGIWHCSRSRVNTILHHLQNAGFISLCQKYGRCLVIGLNHYSEWLPGKPNSPLTDTDIEVDVLGRDPDPLIRKGRKEIARLAAIMKIESEKGNFSLLDFLFRQLLGKSQEVLKRGNNIYEEKKFLQTARYIKSRLEIYVKICPQNHLLFLLNSQAVFQPWCNLMPDRVPARILSFYNNHIKLTI